MLIDHVTEIHESDVSAIFRRQNQSWERLSNHMEFMVKFVERFCENGCYSLLFLDVKESVPLLPPPKKVMFLVTLVILYKQL